MGGNEEGRVVAEPEADRPGKAVYAVPKPARKEFKFHWWPLWGWVVWFGWGGHEAGGDSTRGVCTGRVRGVGGGVAASPKMRESEEGVSSEQGSTGGTGEGLSRTVGATVSWRGCW